ncbi:MAG: glycosyl hydrolase family 32 [Planctomycetota bacterium]
MLSKIGLGVLSALLAAGDGFADEVLYNGIRLTQPWPPRNADFPDDPVAPPYLVSPPRIIPIDIGRQLFVDDFLIAETTLKRTYHLPEYYAENPVMKPDQPWESSGRGPMAMPFSDGVWFDPKDHLFKMWYYAGHGGGTTCYATSKDAIHWEKPKLDVVPGTNIVYKGSRDSGAVWLDHETKDPQLRFKMALYTGGRMILFRSPDGIHWTKVADGGTTGDRSTFFYNPFRRRWVYSIRSSSKFGRSRHYWETADFFRFSDEAQEKGEVVVWVTSDSADPKRDDLNTRPQLYNLDCVAYESLVIGFFSVWRGDYRSKPQNDKWAELQRLGRPKQNSVCIGFSRDGFHWDRPDRRPFCPISEKMGDWNWGNVQSVSPGCLVVGDKLYFHVSGRAGKSYPDCVHADAGGSTGLVILRRDGFASMDAGEQECSLTTRPVTFQGKRLFVNVDASKGQLLVEALDKDGKVITPFSRDNCQPVTADSTIQPVTWKGADDLSALAGKPVRFRFHLTRGRLYSFWVSPDASGASRGYVAAGGPGFTGPTDTIGVAAHKQ